MRGQISGFLPRQPGRTRPGQAGSREAALHYAALGWAVTPARAWAATTDPVRVFTTWTWLPTAPVLAACGGRFDVVEADGPAGRSALGRLDRLGVPPGPVALIRSGPGERMALLVRAGSAAALGALLDAGNAPRVLTGGAFFELPTALESPSRTDPGDTPRVWLRPPTAACAPLPAAHLVLGALAMGAYRRLGSPVGACRV